MPVPGHWAPCPHCTEFVIGDSPRVVKKNLDRHIQLRHRGAKTARCRLCTHIAAGKTSLDAALAVRRHMVYVHDPLEVREALGERELAVFT